MQLPAESITFSAGAGASSKITRRRGRGGSTEKCRRAFGRAAKLAVAPLFSVALPHACSASCRKQHSIVCWALLHTAGVVRNHAKQSSAFTQLLGSTEP